MRKGILIGIISLVAIVIVVGALYFAYTYYQQKNAGVALEFAVPERVKIGEPFTAGVGVFNNSDVIVKNAKLILFLPEGMAFAGYPTDRRVMERNVGDFTPGNIEQQDFELIALDGDSSLKFIDARLTYETASGFTSTFSHRSGVDVVIGQPAVRMTIDTPDTVVSEEQFTTTITIQNTTDFDYKNLTLEVTTPSAYELVSSDPTITEGRISRWDIESLAHDEKQSFAVTGHISGPTESFYRFEATLTADIANQTYPIATEQAEIEIAQSPLSLEVQANKTIAYPGDTVTYVVRYRNNSEFAFENVLVTASLDSALFNFATLKSKGQLDSFRNTLTWNTVTTPQLVSVLPGQGGVLEFEVDLLEQFPVRRLSDKNFSLRVAVTIESPTIPPSFAGAKTSMTLEHETKIAGSLTLDAQAYFRDAPAGIVNGGTHPPRVNLPTQYTIHWFLRVEADDFTDTVVSAKLPAGVRFTNVTKSTLDTKPTYDAITGVVSWNISRLLANQGVVTPPAEAIFQIEFTPSANQAGGEAVLLETSVASGHDAFIDQEVTASHDALTTRLLDDPTTTFKEGEIVP